ncbi:hypothetical protein MFUL124B02_38910 [Myxococcus fulvus 124B02]|nr:hypothetical protein MFUL124B02_38910 [Myxococcus fulvus 124B02]
MVKSHKPRPFKYSDATGDHHARKVEKAKVPGVNRDYSGISKKLGSSKRAHSDVGSQVALGRPQLVRAKGQEPMPQTVDDMRLEAQPSIVQPNLMQLQCMTLFIPFDAGNNFYKQNAKKGTFQTDLVPRQDNKFSPFGQLDVQRPIREFNNKLLPGQSPFERKAVAKTDSDIGDQYNEIVNKHILECTDVNAWKAVHARHEFTRHQQLTQLVPEVIFLSEELVHAPFPDVLQPCPQLKYRKIGSIKDLASTRVDPKNEIAAYVLHDDMVATRTIYNVRLLIRPSSLEKGHQKYEKWLCVQKIAFPHVYIEVAGVHLDANYTKHTAKDDKEQTLEEVGQFARDNGIDALLGDLNMDSFELRGGFFPNRYSFAQTGSSSGSIKPVYTVSHSSSDAKKNYMGGMIVNLDQVQTEPMHWLGHDMIALSRTLDDEFYSDHPAIMANYVKTFT